MDALRLVAVRAEQLQVLNSRCATHRDRDHVVVLKAERAPALNASTPVTLEHGSLHLTTHGAAKITWARLCLHEHVSSFKFPLLTSLAILQKCQDVLGLASDSTGRSRGFSTAAP